MGAGAAHFKRQFRPSATHEAAAGVAAGDDKKRGRQEAPALKEKNNTRRP